MTCPVCIQLMTKGETICQGAPFKAGDKTVHGKCSINNTVELTLRFQRNVYQSQFQGGGGTKKSVPVGQPESEWTQRH